MWCAALCVLAELAVEPAPPLPAVPIIGPATSLPPAVSPLAADPNGLLGVVAQSSAALVALIGGLLVSRYVTLHAEQQTAERRVEDIDRRRAANAADLKGLLSKLQHHWAWLALDDPEVALVVIQNPNASAEDVLRVASDDRGNLDMKVVALELEDLKKEHRAARDFLASEVPVQGEHARWPSYRRASKIDTRWEEIWELVYDQIVDEKISEWRTKAGPLAGLGLSGYRFDALSLTSLPSVYRGPTFEQRLLEDIKIGNSKAATLDVERELALEAYEATRNPDGFSLALRALSFLAIVGIGLPLVGMAVGREPISGWARAAIVLVFGIGLVVLLRYLFVYAHFLDERKGRAYLPHSVTGLFVPRRFYLPPLRRRAERRDLPSVAAPDDRQELLEDLGH